MRHLVLVAFVLSLVILSPNASAVTIGQTDSFESGTQGWRVGGGGGGGGGGPPVNGPKVFANGIDGNYLSYTTDAQNTGGRFLIMNPAQWKGDYLTPGVTGLTAIARNDGDVELAMRLILEGPGGGFFSLSANPLPVGGDWQPIEFSISANDLTGGTDLSTTLASVSQIRIFHNPEPSFPGPFTNASLSIDNIQAVPEPVSPVLFGVTFVLAILRIRKRSRSLQGS